MPRLTLRMLLCLCGAVTMLAQADDARQFRGPMRDGHFADTGLLKTWPEGGPALAWEIDTVGMGYASVTAVGGTLYIPGMLNKDDGYLFALNREGEELWRMSYGKETIDKMAPGSRSTLTVEGNRGYLISGLGVVYCFDLEARKILWQVDTLARFEGKQIRWTIAESPLVDEKYVYCMPGGADAAIAALDKETGKTVWTSNGFSDASGYCSPNIIEHKGRRILVTMSAKYVVGVDPNTGKVLWSHEHQTDYDIHASTPVYADGMLFYVAGSKSGGGMLRLSEEGNKITSAWADTEMDTFHGGVILKEGYIYGTANRSGREMMCLALDSGKIVWRSPEVTESALVFADGMLYAYEGPKKGIVSLVKATPDGFVRTGQFKIEKGTAKHWAHPTIANGRLYIRRGEFLFAYDIKAD
ncbi:MAG: PQQ-like beta-propeller repeat protein [Candidatus Hydrogenedentes bacterium]|nr:PQQ-like beta-propeller repeat protein [Candidatus Hydrogenedentota bacterium]